jgi:hypothetical protein
LLKGLILENTLAGRRITPDRGLHQLSAWHGFAHPYIRTGAEQVLEAVQGSLTESEDMRRVKRLWNRLAGQDCQSKDMIRCCKGDVCAWIAEIPYETSGAG